MPKQLWEKVSKWQIWGLNLCQLPQDPIFLLVPWCHGSKLNYLQILQWQVCTHIPVPQRWELISIRLRLTWTVIRTSNPAQIIFFPQGPDKILHFSLLKKNIYIFFPTLVNYNVWENAKLFRGNPIFWKFSGMGKIRKDPKSLERCLEDFS